MSRSNCKLLSIGPVCLLSLAACTGSPGEPDAGVVVCLPHQPCTGHASGALTADLQCQFLEKTPDWCEAHMGTTSYHLDGSGSGFLFSYEDDRVIGFLAPLGAILTAPNGDRYGLLTRDFLQFSLQLRQTTCVTFSIHDVKTCALPRVASWIGSLDIILGRELPDGGFADAGVLFLPDGGIAPDAGQPDGVFLHFDF